MIYQHAKPVVSQLSLIRISTLLILFTFTLISAIPGYGQTLFEDRGQESGLQGSFDLVQFGTAWGDYDGDGLEDLFVANNPDNQLFRNLGDGTFEDVSALSGIQDEDFKAGGGAWGDYDGDGDLDLFVCNTAAVEASENGDGEPEPVPNRLYRNQGGGVFSDVAAEALVSGEIEGVTGGTFSAAWADYDNDGALDIIVSNRYFGPLLYRNLGNGTFTYATEQAGLEHEEHHEGEEHEEEGEHEHEGHISSAEHAVWSDFDNDGDLDLYLSIAIATEHHHHDEETESVKYKKDQEEASESENLFFYNNGDGTFTDGTEDCGAADPNPAVTHAAISGDYNNDGLMDLFVCNLGSVNEGTAAPSRLFRNDGGTFTDVTAEAGIADDFYALSAAWVDFNNDGYLDLSIIYHPSHDDYPAGVLFTTPHPLYLSNGDGTFTNLNAENLDAIEVTGVSDISHLFGMAWADPDRDGDMDFVATESHGDGPLRFYTNQTAAEGNHWLQVELQSDPSNANCAGARITVTANGQSQIRDAGMSWSGFGSQSQTAEHFGLGDATSASVQVRWTDGTVELFDNVQADQRHQLVKGEGQIISDVEHWVNF